MRQGIIAWACPVFALVLGGMLNCSPVQPAEVVGTWVLTDASRNRLSADIQRARAQLVLRQDGSFVATDLPGLFASGDRDAAKLESGSGVWRFESTGGERQLLLEFRTRSDTTRSRPIGTDLHVSRGSLFYFIGDPDNGVKMSLEKQ